MKQGKGHFIKGAVIIAVGGFIAKLIGALYRIPLTNLIGGKGIGNEVRQSQSTMLLHTCIQP